MWPGCCGGYRCLEGAKSARSLTEGSRGPPCAPSGLDDEVLESGFRLPASNALALASSSASCFALDTILSCFAGSLANMGTRSFGTSLCNLKFLANFIRSLILLCLSCCSLFLRASEYLIFSEFAKSLNSPSTLCSTSFVAVETA